MVLGGYFIMTGRYGIPALVASIIPGILVGTLLFLNEFPDVEADRESGRRNVVISLGREKSSKLYAVFVASNYIWVVLCVLTGYMPLTMIVTFLTLPFALEAVRGVLRDFDNIERLIPSLGVNVILVLSLTAMTSVGLLLSLFI
jgi:1,4-dihydroxy-2-naphthoate octaprenyltransferase